MTTVADDGKTSDRFHPRQWMERESSDIGNRHDCDCARRGDGVFLASRAGFSDPRELSGCDSPGVRAGRCVRRYDVRRHLRTLDISIASTMALAGCALSRVAASGRPGWEAIALALLIGLTVGLVNGVVVVFGRVNPIVATLGMLGIARGLAYIVSGSTFVATQSTVGDAVYAPLQGNISLFRAHSFRASNSASGICASPQDAIRYICVRDWSGPRSGSRSRDSR